ncbi:MAG: hypothetical protein JJV98_20655 [Desulfosarcina sp.]|nr:hypothetical protein [Desulfobacterales bacterium]
MESNGTQVGIVENNSCYIYEDETLEKIASAGLSFSPGSLAYLSGYFLAHDVNTENYYESNLFDGKDWNELEYAITGVNPDSLKGVYAVNGEGYGMGLKSGEVYYNSGSANFSFSKIPGGNIPCGVLAEKSPAEFMGSLILLNNYGVVVQAAKAPVKLSTEHVDRAIESMGKATDAVGFTFTMSGHTFYVLTFPYADDTYVLDLTTNFWYKWGTDGGRWRPNCYMKFNGKHLVGDYENGKIYEISPTTYTDDGTYISRQRAMPVQMSGKRETISSFEIGMQTGVGLSTGQGSDPKICLDYSTDKGKNWTNEIWKDIGKSGEREARIEWRRLGRPYEFTPRVTITDPIQVIMTGAYLNGNR